MRWKSHVRFGERAGETDQLKGWHRAPARLHFMTRGDLHDRRAGRRNSEPYGLSDLSLPVRSGCGRQIPRSGADKEIGTSDSRGFVG